MEALEGISNNKPARGAQWHDILWDTVCLQMGEKSSKILAIEVSYGIKKLQSLD